MRFFDPLRVHKEFITEQKAEWRPHGIKRAAPRWRNVKCIAFIAGPSLIAAMLASGLPVRAHPLEPDRYVLPVESVNNVTLTDLLRRHDFIYLSTVIFVVSGTSQTSPSDWNNSNNTVEGIGGGGSGAADRGNSSSRDGGGGGGEYRKIANFSVATPGTTAFNYDIGLGGAAKTQSTTGRVSGAAGTATTFNSTDLIANPGLGGQASNSGGPGAGGAGGTGGTGAAANADGGTGGGTSGGSAAGGGGGAGGPNGAGVTAASAGANGATAGGNGDNSSGGAGGAADNSVDGTADNGGDGTEWDASHGSGGGGGASRCTLASTNAQAGNGGNYGAGGGAALRTSASDSAISGAGAQGIIVITYTPAGGVVSTIFNLAFIH